TRDRINLKTGTIPDQRCTVTRCTASGIRKCSGTGDEIRGEPVADRLGDDFSGTVLRVDLGALLGEALLRTGNIVADMGERAVLDHNFAGGDFHELIGRA